MTDDGTLDPKFLAGLKVVERTGICEFQIRYHDDEQPMVWIAVAKYRVGPNGLPHPTSGRPHYKVGAGLHPVAAMMQLCEEAIDGGTCAHCHRPAAFDAGHDDTMNKAMTGEAVCWVMWDPELEKFRRGCE